MCLLILLIEVDTRWCQDCCAVMRWNKFNLMRSAVYLVISRLKHNSDFSGLFLGFLAFWLPSSSSWPWSKQAYTTHFGPIAVRSLNEKTHTPLGWFLFFLLHHIKRLKGGNHQHNTTALQFLCNPYDIPTPADSNLQHTPNIQAPHSCPANQTHAHQSDFMISNERDSHDRMTFQQQSTKRSFH